MNAVRFEPVQGRKCKLNLCNLCVIFRVTYGKDIPNSWTPLVVVLVQMSGWIVMVHIKLVIQCICSFVSCPPVFTLRTLSSGLVISKRLVSLAWSRTLSYSISFLNTLCDHRHCMITYNVSVHSILLLIVRELNNIHSCCFSECMLL